MTRFSGKKYFNLASLAFCWTVSSSISLAQVPSESNESRDEIVTLDPFEVQAEENTGYYEGFSAEATRMNIELRDIPISVDIHNREFLDDQFAFNLRETGEYASALYVGSWEQASYTFRGFSTDAANINGLPVSKGNGQSGFQSITNIERIEFLKGPQAILYGGGNFGGTVNRVTKVPREEFGVSTRTILGNYDRKRFELDVTGPLKELGEDGSGIFYRLNYAWEDSGFWRHHMTFEEDFIAPSVLFRFNANTSLKIDTWWVSSKAPGNYQGPVTADGVIGAVRLAPPGAFDDPDFGEEILTADGRAVRVIGDSDVPVGSGGRLARIDNQQSFILPGSFRGVEDTVLMADLRHHFNDHLDFRLQYVHEIWDEDDFMTLPIVQFGSMMVNETEAYFDTWYRENRIDDTADRLRAELYSTFKTGSITHKLLAGVSHDERDQLTVLAQDRNLVPQTGQRWRDALSGGQPVTFDPPSLEAIGATPLINRQNLENVTGAYINEVLGAVDDRVFFQAGFRYEEVELQLNDFRPGQGTSLSEDDATTFSWGAVGHLNEEETLTAYFNANEAFSPSFEFQPDGSGLGPETGDQRELGLKFDLLENKLLGNVTLFEIQQEGLSEIDPDPVRASEGYLIQVPGRKVKGYEFSLSYQPTRSLFLNAEYAHIDAKDTLTGVESFGLWPDKFTLLSKYRFSEDSLVGGLFGTLGFIYQSGFLTDPGRGTVQWTHPDYARIDVGLGYSWRTKSGHENTVRLFVKNLTDDRFLMVRSRGSRYLSEPGTTANLEWNFVY